MTAVGIALAAGTLVFLSVLGVLNVIGVNQTLDAVHKQTANTAVLTQDASKFFKSVGAAVANFEHNEYVTCVAVHATGCLPPPG